MFPDMLQYFCFFSDADNTEKVTGPPHSWGALWTQTIWEQIWLQSCSCLPTWVLSLIKLTLYFPDKNTNLKKNQDIIIKPAEINFCTHNITFRKE